MPFLIIGGHAVNAYGISRQTGDLDLLVPIAHKEKWHALMVRIKYDVIQNDDRFSRYSPPDLAAWPIDFMFVDDATFENLYSESQVIPVGVAEPHIVSARHLLILKLHALKQAQEHRTLKDFNDVLELLRSGLSGVTRDELRLLCEKYANSEWYTKLEHALEHDLR